jgi:hypothetical protein
MALFSTAPRIIVLSVRQRAAVVGREDNHRVLGEAAFA